MKLEVVLSPYRMSDPFLIVLRPDLIADFTPTVALGSRTS